MNKKNRFLLIGMLALSVLAGLFSGCSKTEGSKQEITKDTVVNTVPYKSDKQLEFTMLYNDMTVYPYKSDWLLWDQIKKLTNVSLKLTIVPFSDYIQKRSLLISTGDAPEIMPKTYPGQEVQYIASGAILPISDYVNMMPNYTKKVNDWKLQADINTLKQKDGKYYVLPGLHEVLNQDYSLIYRADIFEKNNIKVPDTWDELETSLKKLKELYPDSIPYSDRQQLNISLNISAPSFGAIWGWNYGNGLMYDESKDSFIFSPITEEYKSMLTYFSKLVKEGLLDPDSLTQTDDMAYQKFISGKSFVIGGNSQDVNLLEKTMDDTLGKDNYKITKMVILGGPKGSLLSGSRLENGIMFSAKAKNNPNFEQMLKFVDWLWYSDEGQVLSKWGVEGTTYKISDGKYQLMPDVTFQTLNPSGTKDLRKQFGFSNGVFSYGGKKELAQSMMSQEDLTFLDGVNKKVKLVPSAPPVLLSEDEREQSTLLSKPLVDYVNQMTYKFILGKSDLNTDWNQYVTDCKIKGSDKLLQLTNRVYNATKASLK